MAKAGWQNSGNGVRIVIELQFSPNNVWIRAELPAPQGIADDHRIGKPRHRILRAKQPPYLRCNAEHREIIGTDNQQFHADRVATASHVVCDSDECAYVLEDPRRLEIVELRDRKCDALHT